VKRHEVMPSPSLDDLFRADAWARATVAEEIRMTKFE
jgi:hypothetical protein